MWNYIINIHSSELLSTTIKEFRIKKKMDNFHFIPNNILTEFCKELMKF